MKGEKAPPASPAANMLLIAATDTPKRRASTVVKTYGARRLVFASHFIVVVTASCGQP